MLTVNPGNEPCTNQNLFEQSVSDTLLSNLTATFDEKLRLLLDPHYQSSPSAVNRDSSSDQMSSQQQQMTAANSSPAGGRVMYPLKQRSRSLQQQEHETGPEVGHSVPEAALGNRKPGGTELKRGRLVDKTKDPRPPFLRGHSASNILNTTQWGTFEYLAVVFPFNFTAGFLRGRGLVLYTSTQSIARLS